MKEGESVTALSDSICQDRSLIISGCDFSLQQDIGHYRYRTNNANMQSMFSHWLTKYEYVCIQKRIITTCRADNQFCPD